MADPLRPPLLERIQPSLPMLMGIGALFAVMLGWFALPLLPKLMGEQPRIAEIHKVTGLSAILASRTASPVLHTQSQSGKSFVFNIRNEDVGECEIGQPIVIWRVGASAVLDDEVCRREAI